ncbi:MAG TPA: beta-ketoacyl synthase N-terminal-like domain-containing protein, partial [Umezawaea sp.]|nr:beta-ketoacyl synthase N-terminal-like domain-containing protein [Umezawaea sp.]
GQRSCLWSVSACYASVVGLGESDHVLWPAPLFHSLAHILCVLGVTAVGATAHVLSGFSADATVKLLRDEPVTFFVGVPTMYHYLVREVKRSGVLAPHLRTCLVAGSPLPPELRREFEDLFGVALLDGYGSTETCGLITVTPPGAERVEGSCGLPVPGLDVKVVNPDDGSTAEPGAEGEVWVRGPNLMIGYHERPDATEAALVDGWYRTGDLARADEHGRLTISGRIKELIIRSGENLSPREIEEVVKEVDGVADAAVAGLPHPAYGEVPVAFVVREDEPTVTGTALTRTVLAHCRERLSPGKVPAEVRFVEGIPRTASGKIKRQALRDAAEQVRVDDEEISATAAVGSGSAELIDVVCAGVAALRGPEFDDEIDPDSSFRELGLTSLTAVELCHRISAAVGAPVSTTSAFDHPTPAALARHVRTVLSSAGPSPVDERRRSVAADEPIAVVGMACRFPGGVSSPEDLWRLLSDGGEVIGEFPTDRGWDLAALFDPDPDKPGTSYTRRGGFLPDPGGFDAALFGISPREALMMDPQQRLLLETTWELFERAGIPTDTLRGTDTGVFAGAMHQDYAVGADDPQGQLLTGTAGSVLSGRVSYVFGLQGPAVTVDTACSSSLVATHLASQALRSGECSLAVAGGVTIMTTPNTFVQFSRQRGLSADGRCKAFSDNADGTGWSEGSALLLLERQSDAIRNNHRIWGLIRGSAINQDGASNGLTAPNGPAQQRVIQAALTNAGLSTSDIDAVEAHGTGTTLGDPIEAQALQAIYGQDRENPLQLGSIKSNIGHTQAAAGIAGTIKMLLAMHHGTLPATLHAETPTRHIDWANANLRLTTETQPWPTTGRPHRAGISSFGVSGTNAHLIIEQAPPITPEVTEHAERPNPWVLSAHTAAALQAQAVQLLHHVEHNPDLTTADIAHTLVRHRTSTLAHRAVVLGTDALTALAHDTPHSQLITGTTISGHGSVFVFPGQGSQWIGMATQLQAESPAFARALDECAAALAPHT